ncbi:hypothetical protein SCLCIDRAFT_461162 [Scleroderma citrinum Foug A]|uniref:Uncharacterized protein n=1 Tax=Scleroderma citrinum Foug A TaxID=1036808 RepID=A0A0C2YU06_9AGAM|nr:hypothetical protein SCLCIDRAFT_461162 [Scleroderma citrinum Foug A]
MTTLELFTRKRPFDHLQSIRDIIDCIVNKELTRPSLDASFFRLTDEWWKIYRVPWIGHSLPSSSGIVFLETNRRSLGLVPMVLYTRELWTQDKPRWQ